MQGSDRERNVVLPLIGRAGGAKRPPSPGAILSKRGGASFVDNARH